MHSTRGGCDFCFTKQNSVTDALQNARIKTEVYCEREDYVWKKILIENFFDESAAYKIKSFLFFCIVLSLSMLM